MNINNGQNISEIAHIKQSVTNILTTPIGSRVMRRDYGSRLFEKIDRPLNGELIAEIYYDITESLFIWEPRFELEQIIIQNIGKGKIIIDIIGNYLIEGKKITLENIQING